MSMSQEEIEALMNGLDIVDDDAINQEESSIVNTNEIEELISQNKEVNSSIDDTEESPKIEVETTDEEASPAVVDNNDIDALIKELEVLNIDEVIDETIEDTNSKSLELLEKIDKEIFPLPVDNDTKVVNQLSEVANDSEEIVSQIFDVLSLTLDNNNVTRSKVKELESYLSSEQELLNSLCAKFPNIEVLNTQKELTNEMFSKLKEIENISSSEDIKIFEAMELIQFKDINKQKIERVMSVIRKLSLYLNNLFEDTNSSQEIVVTNHIHGDKDHDLIGDDLDKLINEFGNKG